MALKRWAPLLLACAALAAQANPYYDPDKRHHTREGFRNNYVPYVNRPFSDLIRWRWESTLAGLPLPAAQATPVVLPQLARLQANGTPSATWIGHATVLVQSGGLNVLTDPIFSERASPFTFVGPRRAQPPGIPLEQLPPIDVVVISHNHYDHLDRWSAAMLSERAAGKTLFLVPLGLKPFLERHGITNVVELDWWDRHVHRGVEFHLVPVQHWSARSLGDRNETLWGGWAVFAPDLRWYFSGDAGYSRDFSDTRARLAGRERDGALFELALLAIGAYEPRWFMTNQHMNPAEAVKAHRDLGARQSLGVHWGTFALTDESLDRPPRDLAAAREEQGVSPREFFVLPIGGSWFKGQSGP